MQSIKAEASKLIKNHFEELNATAQEIGGVYIARLDGAVAVYGTEGSEKKIIFRTSFVSESENKLLDTQIEIQDLLEEEGIEAISEFDFNEALGGH